jgi:hypothetical protein
LFAVAALSVPQTQKPAGVGGVITQLESMCVLLLEPATRADPRAAIPAPKMRNYIANYTQALEDTAALRLRKTRQTAPPQTFKNLPEMAIVSTETRGKINMSAKRFLNSTRRRNLRFGPVVGLLLGIAALAACQTQQQIVAQHEDNLAAAGFIVRPANTPQRQEMLNRLPPHRFVQRVHGDTVHYIYADPLVCDCLYVGTQEAYNQYKLHQQQQHLADEQQMTAQDYSDAAWRWDAWGPWGPVGPRGFVYGAEIGW